jgi:hypothetical protein
MVMPSRRRFVVLLLVVGLAGCAMARHRQQVREGLLVRGLHRDAFLKEWGPPTRTYTVESPEPVLKMDAFTSSWRRPIYEVWEYRERGTCLTFEGVRLMAWERDKSDCKPSPRPLPPPRRRSLPPAYPPPPS